MGTTNTTKTPKAKTARKPRAKPKPYVAWQGVVEGRPMRVVCCGNTVKAEQGHKDAMGEFSWTDTQTGYHPVTVALAKAVVELAQKAHDAF